MRLFAGPQHILKKRFRTLPSRISLFVFGSTVLTTAVCAYISINSFQEFLDERIDEKFPSVLMETASTIEHWYGALGTGLDSYQENEHLIPGELTAEAFQEVAKSRVYRLDAVHALKGLLQASTRFSALFILNPAGKAVAWAGEHPQLPLENLEKLGGTDHPSISNLVRVGDNAYQFVSIPLRNEAGDILASLHGIVDLEALANLVQSEQIGESGKIFILDEKGRTFTSLESRESYEHILPELWADPKIQRYRNDQDERVIGCSIRLGHFGWTLAVEELQSEAFAPRTAIVRKVLVLNLTIILLFSGISLLLARTISRPVRELAKGARRITAGETDVVIMEHSAHDEIALLTLAFNRMSKKLHQNQLDLNEKQERIEKNNAQLLGQNRELQGMVAKLNELSITDGLTKLYNHRYFQQQLRVEIARATRSKAPLFIVLIDIDNFKNLNDHYGHAAGDLILSRVADIMRTAIRENDLLARYGGEEFALVPGQTDLEGAMALAEKIRMSIGEARFQVDTSSVAEKVTITVSVGVAHFTGDLKQSFNYADQALYRAKADGKDCVRLYGVDD
jgi:diguanylate cyclase (GGDEF)-like protein